MRRRRNGPQDQHYYENNQKQEKQNFSNTRCSQRDTGKTENRRNNRNYKKIKAYTNTILTPSLPDHVNL
jgi:hypothetical protein